ncbi:MAG: SAM-dependent methyltransferase, partial [Bacteroidota bacterium]
IELTVFENNYILPSDPTKYEATFVYLIRRRGELSIHTDRHTLGNFPEAIWLSLLNEAGLAVSRTRMDEVYERYLLDEDDFPMHVFIGVKAE